MGLDDLLMMSPAELEDWHEMRSPSSWREVTVLQSELRHAANSLEEKVYRMKYYDENPDLSWLTELSLNLTRMLRNAQEKKS